MDNKVWVIIPRNGPQGPLENLEGRKVYIYTSKPDDARLQIQINIMGPVRLIELELTRSTIVQKPKTIFLDHEEESI